jgi:hypothetical protein
MDATQDGGGTTQTTHGNLCTMRLQFFTPRRNLVRSDPTVLSIALDCGTYMVYCSGAGRRATRQARPLSRN